jgi:hypothetical protein
VVTAETMLTAFVELEAMTKAEKDPGVCHDLRSP